MLFTHLQMKPENKSDVREFQTVVAARVAGKCWINGQWETRLIKSIRQNARRMGGSTERVQSQRKRNEKEKEWEVREKDIGVNRICPSYGFYGDSFGHKGWRMNHSLELKACEAPGSVCACVFVPLCFSGFAALCGCLWVWVCVCLWL